jgi:hypothetical protein
MPIKAFDYFAAGLPIVNSLGRDLGSAVNQYKVGMQYKSGDATSLFNAIKSFIDNRDMKEQFRKNAENVAWNYDVSRQYCKFVNIIEAL